MSHRVGITPDDLDVIEPPSRRDFKRDATLSGRSDQLAAGFGAADGLHDGVRRVEYLR